MSRHRAAAHFRVGVSSAIRWMARARDTGDVRPKSMGGDHRSAPMEAQARFLLSMRQERSDATLREFVTIGVTGYLTALWQQGSLAGTTPDEAFLVRTDDEVNPPQDAASGQFFVDVAVAVVLPAQFIIVRIGRTEDTLAIEEVA